MSQRITRREVCSRRGGSRPGTAGAGHRASRRGERSRHVAASGFPTLPVRPYQLMCVVCRLGAGCTDDLGEPRLTAILKAVRQDPKLPLTLRCNVDTVYRYQNPGHAEDTAEGELFNAKRDLDIVQKLGLVPGDTRPAIDMFERVLAKIPQARGICGYETQTSDTWRGCAQAGSGNYEKGHKLGINAIIPPRDPQEKAQYKKTSAAAIYQAPALQIRPHHLLCMSCFHGGKDKLAPICGRQPVRSDRRDPEAARHPGDADRRRVHDLSALWQVRPGQQTLRGRPQHGLARPEEGLGRPAEAGPEVRRYAARPQALSAALRADLVHPRHLRLRRRGSPRLRNGASAAAP